IAFGVPGHAEDSMPVVPELGAHPAGLRVPDFHDLVVARRSNPPAVGAEGHAADFIAVLDEGQGFLAGLVVPEWGPIPDANGPVGAGRSEAVAVRAECHAHAPVGVSTQVE